MKRKLFERTSTSTEGNVTVCSLDEFKKICENELGITDSNAESEEFKNLVFIEIGSTYDRVYFEFGLTRPISSMGRQYDAEDYFNNKRFYFHEDHPNVLKLTFDDNIKVGTSKKVEGGTPLKLRPSEMVPDYAKEHKFGVYGGKSDSAVNVGSYLNAIHFSEVCDKTYEFIENKINEIGCDNIHVYLHCEQGASRSGGLGYYIAKRLGNNIESFFKQHSSFDDDGNFKSTQLRIKKSRTKNKYRTMNHPVFKLLGKKYNDNHKENKIDFSDTDIRNFVDKYNITEDTILTSTITKIINEYINKNTKKITF